ncbi:MAG: FAD-dependent oxidoreductase [Actinobacteria bacterium]|nr:FAD-dependent oxidoreductase [Actinomycetota bacterium]
MSADNDVVILGGGVAALTAASYAARLGLRAACVTDILVGGQIVNVADIENFPGLSEARTGMDLAAQIEQQARESGVEFIFGEALGIAAAGDGYDVSTTEGGLAARAVIVATGSRLRRLGVAGEDRLQGVGVSYCGSCDGPLFAGRPVIVVGGGDSAADEALAVAEHAAETVIVTREARLSAAAATVERVLADERISVRPFCEPTEILGDSAVSGVRLRDVRSGAESEVEAAGVFVFVGLDPNTSLLRDLADLDESGYVETDAWMATRSAGLFAAGDLRRDSPRQLVNAASDGATAAIAAHRYLSVAPEGAAV